MKKIDIHFISNGNNSIITKEHSVKISINITDLSTFELSNKIKKIKTIINLYSNLKRINIIFSDDISEILYLSILTKFHDCIYNYKGNTFEIKIYSAFNNNILNYLDKYKQIVMEPNKTPTSFLDWIIKNIPSEYKYQLYENNNDFKLLQAVAVGSEKPYYFIHISPKNENPGKNIYLVGKAITYDSGGLNIKTRYMNEMKVDMIGAAIIITVLNLLKNPKSNINLIIPIAENMIGPKSTKPGSVVTTIYNKSVEIENIDAEGRLCIVDGIDYIENKLIKNHENSIIIDIATLTGNASHITESIAAISCSNKVGEKYNDILIDIGENIGEYIDKLKLREEYKEYLHSKVADIKNINENIMSDCIMGGVFINHFVNPNTPWIHIDVANVTYINETVLNFGINLLYQFIQKI